MSIPQLSGHIASQIRRRRQQKGWSLDKTADATGVSKAMLGQIERQESSPTIATLWKIATGLNCSFSSLLAAPVAPDDTRYETFEHDPHMRVKTLFGFSSSTQLEMFELTLSDFHAQLSPAHQMGVTEHLYVVEGQLGVLSGDTWSVVNQGEAFLLHADQQHGYRDEVGLTRFISAIHYPSHPGGR